jgi:hypothetical protein
VYVLAEAIDLTIYLSTCPPSICLFYLPNHLPTNQINQLTYLPTYLPVYLRLGKATPRTTRPHLLHKKAKLYGIQSSVSLPTTTRQLSAGASQDQLL